MPTFSDSLLKNQCLIDGVWVGTPALSVTNPATGAVIGKVPDMGVEDTRAAIGFSGVEQTVERRTQQNFAPLVRPDH